MEKDNQDYVQQNIDKAADNQIVQRAAGISDRTQDTGTYIINEDKDDSGKIDAQIGGGRCDDLLGGVHPTKHHWRQPNSNHRNDHAAHHRKGKRSMQRILQSLFLPCTIILGDDHRCTGRKSDKKTDNQVDDLAGGAAHRRQCFGTDKSSHDNRICRVVDLLKKGAQHNRKKENQQLFPNHAADDLVLFTLHIFHLDSSSKKLFARS